MSILEYCMLGTLAVCVIGMFVCMGMLIHYISKL